MKNVEMLGLLKSFVSSGLFENNLCAYQEAKKAIEALEKDIRLENNKAKGKTVQNVAKAMQKVLKAAASNNTNHIMKYAFKCDGYTVVLDGHMLIATLEDVDLPMLPDTEKPFNVKPFLDQMAMYDSYTTVFSMPTIKEVKSSCDLYKKQFGSIKKIPYEIEYNRLYINPDFLIIAEEATGSTEAKNESCISPIFFSSDNKKTFALVLPINNRYALDDPSKVIRAL